MDESFNWYLHWVQGQIEIWWGILQPHLISDFALHAYAAVGIIDTFACTFVIAYFARLRLADLKVVALGNKLIGRPGTRAETVKNQLNKLMEKTIRSLCPYARDFILLLIFGLVVPSILLFLLTVHYTWLDIGGIPFVDLHGKRPLHIVDTWPLVVFIGNQILHGALLDFPEIFDLDIGSIRNNPSDITFSLIVFLFRTVATLFAAALWVAIRDTFIVFRTLNKNGRKKMAAATPAMAMT